MNPCCSPLKGVEQEELEGGEDSRMLRLGLDQVHKDPCCGFLMSSLLLIPYGLDQRPERRFNASAYQVHKDPCCDFLKQIPAVDSVSTSGRLSRRSSSRTSSSPARARR